jgi:hypothetical protein
MGLSLLAVGWLAGSRQEDCRRILSVTSMGYGRRHRIADTGKQQQTAACGDPVFISLPL